MREESLNKPNFGRTGLPQRAKALGYGAGAHGKLRLGLVAALVLFGALIAPSAQKAQATTGSATLYGEVNSLSGNPIAGLSVCLEGNSAPACSTTTYIITGNQSDCPAGSPAIFFAFFFNLYICTTYSITVTINTSSGATNPFILEIKASPGNYTGNSILDQYPQIMDILSQETVQLNANENLNLTVPAYPVFVHTQDTNGSATSGMPIKASSLLPQSNNNGSLLLAQGAVSNLQLTYAGQYYTDDPTVSFSQSGCNSPPTCPKTAATATATINGNVQTVAVTNAGSGYTSAPSVVFTPTDSLGSGATATANLLHYVATGTGSIAVTNGGSGYSNSVSNVGVNFSGGCTTEPVATASTNGSGVVTSINVTSQGSGCSSAPSVTVAAPSSGTTATATASLSGGYVGSITVTNGGSLYNHPPTVSFSGGGGSAAAATATIYGFVNSLVLNYAGSGYNTAAISVNFTGTLAASPNNLPATATAQVGLAAYGNSSYDDAKAGAVTTDGSGNAVLWLLASTSNLSGYNYNIAADPASDSSYGPGNANNVNVPDNQNAHCSNGSYYAACVTITTPNKVYVNGYVYDGNPTAGDQAITVCAESAPASNAGAAGVGGEICSAATSTSAGPGGNSPIWGQDAACQPLTIPFFSITINGTCPYSYQFRVVPGNYNLEMKADFGAGQTNAPQKFTVVTTNAVTIPASPGTESGCGYSDQYPNDGLKTCAHINLAVPEFQVNIRVLDSATQQPVTGMPIDASSNAWQTDTATNPLRIGAGSSCTCVPSGGIPSTANGVYDSTQSSATSTDANGYASLWLFRSTSAASNFAYNITAHPANAAASQYSRTTISKTVTGSVSQGSAYIIDMVGKASLSGTVLDADQTPVQGVTVAVETGLHTNSTVDSSITDANGNYTLYTSPGNYYLKVSSQPGFAGGGSSQTLLYETGAAKSVRGVSTPPISLFSDQTEVLNVTLPQYRVDVLVQNSSSTPQSGAGLDAASICPQTGLGMGSGLAGLTLVHIGSGYTGPPNVVISGGGGSGATGQAFETSGHVTLVELTNAGSGYTSAPTVTITPTNAIGSGATATATLMPAGTACSSYDHTKPGPATTNGSGIVTLWLMASVPSGGGSSGQPYAITANPSSGNYVPTTVTGVFANADLTGGSEVVITLNSPVSFQGSIHDPDNNPVTNTTVALEAQSAVSVAAGQSAPPSIVASAITDNSGNFNFSPTGANVPPGYYFLYIYANPGDGQTALAQSFSLETNTATLDIDNGVNNNVSITLPEHKVNITATDTQGNALSGVAFDAKSPCPQTSVPITVGALSLAATGCSRYDANNTSPATTDSNGLASLWLLNSNPANPLAHPPYPGQPYNINGHPPSGTTYLLSTANNVFVSDGVGDQSLTMQLPIPVQLSGTLMAGDGVTPATNVHFGIETACTIASSTCPSPSLTTTPTASTTTDVNGAFSFTIPSGVYYIKIWSSPATGAGNAPTGVPQSMTLETTTTSSYQSDTALSTITLPETLMTLNLVSSTGNNSLINNVTFDAHAIGTQCSLGQGGEQATAAPVIINGVVTGNSVLGQVGSVSVTNGGSAYLSAPTVSFVGGGGSGAAGTATLNTSGNVSAVTLTNGGSGYTSPPSVVFSGGGASGSGAAATANLASALNVTNGGSLYTSAPSVSILGGGTGATAKATILNGVVNSVTLLNPGSGYTAPTVKFSGGGGTGASAAASTANGIIKSIAVTCEGNGYTSTPSVAIGGAGSGASATATVVHGAVTAISVNCPAATCSGYTNPTTVTLDAPATAAPTFTFSGFSSWSPSMLPSDATAISGSTSQSQIWLLWGSGAPYTIAAHPPKGSHHPQTTLTNVQVTPRAAGVTLNVKIS